jgi:hypothetical protein
MDVNEAAQTIADLVQPKGDNGLLAASFEEVIQQVWDEAHSDGESEGWHDGFDEGNSQGWDEGYERGVEVGREDD